MTAQAQRGKKSLTKTLGNYSFILIFAVILIAYLIINGGATTLSGVMNILRHSAVVGIMAFGMGLVIITGGIDLSVGSMLAMIGGLGVVAFNATSSVFVTFLTVLAVGCVLGFFNGHTHRQGEDAALHRYLGDHAHLPLRGAVLPAHHGPVHLQHERHHPPPLTPFMTLASTRCLASCPWPASFSYWSRW